MGLCLQDYTGLCTRLGPDRYRPSYNYVVYMDRSTTQGPITRVILILCVGVDLSNFFEMYVYRLPRKMTLRMVRIVQGHAGKRELIVLI